MIIESKAPTRVDFAGGTLDIWPLYLFHPGAVTVNAAISLYATCVIETNDPGDNRIKLVSRDIKCGESFASFAALVKAKRYRLPLLAEITKFFHPQGGFALTTDSEAPAGAGIGGSSAMAIAICAALDRFTGTGKSKVDWIHISRDAEAIVINVQTGTQDHYPPAFGGAATIDLPPGGEHRVELRVNLSELERRIVVAYTGKPRQHAINNWEVFTAHLNRNRAVQHSLVRTSTTPAASTAPENLRTVPCSLALMPARRPRHSRQHNNVRVRLPRPNQVRHIHSSRRIPQILVRRIRRIKHQVRRCVHQLV